MDSETSGDIPGRESTVGSSSPENGFFIKFSFKIVRSGTNLRLVTSAWTP